MLFAAAMTKSCSVWNCDPVHGSSKFFYTFPSDFDMCMQWVQNTSDEALWQEFQYGGAYPFLGKHVCSDHFLDIDYKIFGDRKSGLRHDAVPFTTTIKPDTIELTVDGLDPLLESVESVILGEDDNDAGSFDPSKAYFLEQLNIFQKGKFPTEEMCTSICIKNEEDADDNFLEEVVLKDRLRGAMQYYKIPTEKLNLSTKKRGIFRMQVTAAEKRAEQRKNETSKQRALRLEKNRLRIMAKRRSETIEEKLERRQKCAMRASISRANESEERKQQRLDKSRIRAAESRRNMTPEQREVYRLKHRILTRKRRQHENEIEKILRRCNNAMRASVKRSEETEEEKKERRFKDALRAAQRRQMETPEEREERLRKDRERVQLKRTEIKMKETPEQKEERLRKGRERMYRKRHQTPEMMDILKSIHAYLVQNQITAKQVTSQNINDLISLVKSSHPNLSVDYLENAVGSFISSEDLNQLGLSFSTDESSRVSNFSSIFT